jgi:hypothetical protein
LIVISLLGGYILNREGNSQINYDAIELNTVDGYIHILSLKYGVSEALARAIIGCESRWKPNAVGYNYRKTGELWSKDIGYFQINDFYNEEWLLREKGWHIYDWRDNLEAGFYMLKERGTSPWLASASCWRDRIDSGYNR